MSSVSSPAQHHHSTAAICIASFFIAVASVVNANNSNDGTGDDEKENGQDYYLHDAAKIYHRLNVSKCEEVNIPPSLPGTSTAAIASTKNNITLYKPLTRIQQLVYPHSYLPTPRLLSPTDTVFSYPQLTRGLIQRQKDEQRLRNLLSSAQQVVKLRATTDNNNNQEKQQQQQQQLLQEMNTIVYGAGITSQIRQQFVIEYGCTGYTLDILHHLVMHYADRGIIEIGAGHGQWAKALHDYYQKMKEDTTTTTATATNEETNSNSDDGQQQQHSHHQTRHQTRHSWMLHDNKFIVAYDNKESLPLSSSVLSSPMSKTTTSSTSAPSSLQTSSVLPPPTHEEIKTYFYNNVHTLNNIEAVSKYANGRALLLVYPPSGSMSLDTVLAYINATSSNSNHHPNCKHYHHNQYHDDENISSSSSSTSSTNWKNDIVIYVGEGQGGANANDDFFDYFLGISNNNTNNNNSSGSWVLEKVMSVKTCPGDKGYEKLFILRRV